MAHVEKDEVTVQRTVPVEMSADEFRRIGHRLVDQIAELLTSLPHRQVTPGESPEDVRSALKADTPLPTSGTDADRLLQHTTKLLTEHSLYNSHPRFWGYVTAGATPIGVLGDLLASGVNANVGGWKLSPMATEIEAQTVRWIADLIGYPTECSGLLVSGGNMANFVGFLAARAAKANWNIREHGFGNDQAKRMMVYTSAETHTWVQKAADLFGLGTNSIRWIPTDSKQRMDISALRSHIEADRTQGLQPFMVIGTAGSVSTGAVDPLYDIAAIAREYDLWFHIDGAYGGFAAQVPGVPEDLRGLSEADSVAVDPHKWLYAPLEAGCALVRNAEWLTNAFSYHPPYYHFGQSSINFVDYGMQNSRGFRALKVWLALQQAGREGYMQMIGDDIRLSQEMFRAAQEQPELETFTQELSIATFRFVPDELRGRMGQPETEEYLNRLNEEIMIRLEKSGEAFVSHAVINGQFVLRACIVNFRTTRDDVRALPPLVCRIGRAAHSELKYEVGNLK